ncbi:response regulator transcription factor [Streptococcus sp. HF-1907]|uniref:response regulator transcription factor n=1 Tax=Streptococcus sp. HF-1907 TaxID=2785793 RepID=UPI00189FEED4|nr:response regulator transcription factor [Streptococcus sp. HF-1907]MBF7095131.1 response regulator transcription factor [Streptococcus sp. HF-1907]
MKKRVYAADDDASIREILETFLVDAGYDVQVFETGDALLECFKSTPCDMVLLDIMMPGRSGLEITKLLRAQSKVPIILLTAKDTDMDYVLGINSGSDDYMMKPFRPSILVSRMKSLFRRIDMDSAQMVPNQTIFGDLRYSDDAHAIFVGDKNLMLTETELQVLKYLMLEAGKAVARETLLDKVWGISAELETRVTDETVRRIRKKLSTQQSRVALTTVWGYGYKLEEHSL